MDAKAIRAYGLPAVPEIILTPGGIRNELAHLRQFGLRRDYRAQSKLKGRTCIIEVTPEQVELLR